ncbi:shikimate dehydrogenase [Crateriforma conspicua]|uniref:Shikimate dehydrogenase (NADP(+)) n=1 Tax=Crateriforma conspicua TaxID=2527996 RepID=A0A5C5YCT9_9PLAN|nr:shikimate dehydrogenase [Crateriforma conspicua]QDV61482.1 Shikimate dehydrogenase [Crateriforma conspicua]TWT72271.1 Shikimate dehydrogenase [Crateriforma conspicua]
MPEITPDTIVCALFGHPVGHSMSPAIHNAAFDALGLPYVYVAHDVTPGQVGEALRGVRAMGYRGLSVTIPHKVEAMENVDVVDPTAQGIGCINTVVNNDGVLTGFNSDGRGALNALIDADADPQNKNVLILSSGGAARAIAVTLVRENPPQRIAIAGKTESRVQSLVADVQSQGGTPIVGCGLNAEALKPEVDAADIIIHCSPVGMHPNEDATLIPAEWLRRDLAVFDAVYNPRRTKLLSDTLTAGGRTIEGLEMFLGQAYVQFELWTGQPAPRDVMRRVVESRL